MTIVLRPDQWALKLGVYAAWNAGARNVLGVLPTGGGKSVISSDITLDKHQLGAKQVVIAHRTELVDQMSLHVARRGIKHRIIGPKAVVSQCIAAHRREFNGYSFISPTANCSVAGVDTLIARSTELEDWAKQIDYFTIDEAHHVQKMNKWGRAINLFPNAFGLGITASPRRADGGGLGRDNDGIFDHMELGPDMRTLINLGALADYEIVIPESDFHIDEADLPPSGDFSNRKMREASQRSHIVGDVVKEYCKYAFGKRGITFATDVETATEIAKRFNEQGIPAASVSALTPSEVRADFIRRFREGQLWMLVNVDLFGEGFDVPAVEVVIMARPTASLAVYLQQFGRALRPLPGKLFGLVIDHVSNWKRHGFPDKAHYWTLERREKRGKRDLDPEDIPLTVCRNCSRPYERFHTCCPRCGHVPIILPSQRLSIEEIDGDLMLLDRAKLEEMRKATVLPSPGDVGSRTTFVAGDFAGKRAVAAQIERIQAQQALEAAIAQWAGVQRARGRPDPESYKRFYLTTGVDVLTALAQPRAAMDELRGKIEGWLQ